MEKKQPRNGLIQPAKNRCFHHGLMHVSAQAVKRPQITSPKSWLSPSFNAQINLATCTGILTLEIALKTTLTYKIKRTTLANLCLYI